MFRPLCALTQPFEPHTGAKTAFMQGHAVLRGKLRVRIDVLPAQPAHSVELAALRVLERTLLRSSEADFFHDVGCVWLGIWVTRKSLCASRANSKCALSQTATKSFDRLCVARGLGRRKVAEKSTDLGWGMEGFKKVAGKWPA